MEGYKKLTTFVLATVICDLTVQFVKKWIDPRSRTTDQMEQAARSGKQNIAEGYTMQSLESYIKLCGVANGSFKELASDFEDFLRQRNLEIWDKEDPRVRKFRAFRAVWVSSNRPNTPNLPNNPEEAANMILTYLQMETFLLTKQIESLKAKFVKEGGFRENLFKKRLSQKAKAWEKGFIKLTKKTLLLSLIALIILTALPLSLLFPKKVSAEWYDDNWTYRTSYSNNNTGAAVTNQKIKLDIDTATLTTDKLQADCGDSRFTDQNGNLLRYYIDGSGGACDGASTDYYVLVPTINAGRTIIYHYYGNPSAPNGTEASQFTEATFSPASTTAASEEKGPGPVAYWKFDDGTGTNAQDSSINNNDGTISGATWQTEDMCINGKCLYVDGSNDVVTVVNTVSNIQTVSFWVKPITTSEQFIDLNGSAYIQSSSGTISATGFTSPTIYVNGKVSSTIAANQWQYVTVTTGSALTGSAIKIGQISTNYGQGFIDDVKIYNYARSAAQILADYNARGTSKGVSALLGGGRTDSPEVGTPGTLSNGLVGYWKMDESSGNATDSSGNGTTLTNNNTTTYAAGKFGNSGSFTAASSHYFSTATTISGVKTVAFWTNPTATTDEFINLTSSTYITASSGTVSATGFTGPLIYVNGVLNGTITANTFNHVVVTTDTAINANAFEVGRANSAYVNGKVDETRVYNRALSPKEVEALYNFAPGPKVELKMEEGSGTTANDSSGNANTGTVSSGTWTTGKYGKGVSVTGSSGSNVSVSDFSY